jgi:hypothetical protein
VAPVLEPAESLEAGKGVKTGEEDAAAPDHAPVPCCGETVGKRVAMNGRDHCRTTHRSTCHAVEKEEFDER